jgi:hypothetical protein
MGKRARRILKMSAWTVPAILLAGVAAVALAMFGDAG